MICKINKKDIEVVLIMTGKEASLLKELLQNPLSENELEIETKLRKDIFDTLTTEGVLTY